MKPTVDVIVPCFNYGSYLESCVESVLSQEDVTVCVIIMDDASTDNTEVIGRRLAKRPGVEYRRHVVNRGHIATYNEALTQVTGDYCMVLSADDMLTPGALRRATALMEAEPMVGLVYGRDIPFQNEAPVRIAPAFAPGKRIVGYIEFLREACALGHTGIQAPTALVRTSLHREIGGYDPELPHTADTEIWLRMASASMVAQLEADQAYRRVHASNMSLGFTPLQRLAEQVRAFELHFELQQPLSKELASLQDKVRRTIAEAAVWNAARVFELGDGSRCDEFLAFARSLSPGIQSWEAWRRLQWKRRIGTTAWSVINPLVNRARRIAQPAASRGLT
jgi:GT2 family glycosyltransferase